jgi:hypothetical protein
MVQFVKFHWPETIDMFKTRTATWLPSAALIAALSAHAQQPAAPSAPPAAQSSQPAASETTDKTTTTSTAATSSATAATAPSSSPSEDVLKKARRAGFKPETVNGVTRFCYKDATLGTHFETKKCYDEAGMLAELNQRQDERDQMKKMSTCHGAGCGSN